MRIAIVGAGIAGMSAAWLLSPENDVDVYEAEPVLGGHAHTVEVQAGGASFPVDTGFMVFNTRTYPNLIRFFDRLGIEASDADMSFSVQIPSENIEWSGTDLNTVFAQRKNIVNPRFLQMLADVLRLSANADRLLNDPTVAGLTLGQLLDREGYSKVFTDWYLVPMGASIWSTPPGEMLDYPALTFLRFCDNHGLLHVTGKPQWLSVRGGSRTYVSAVERSISGSIHTGEPVTSVVREDGAVRVTTAQRSETYDAVVMACHPPQTREIMGDGMAPLEHEILGSFEYYTNDVLVHTDTSFMPKAPLAWASWNWYSETCDACADTMVLSYHINTLQDLPSSAPPVLETLNRHKEPAAGTVLEHLVFDHPRFDAAAIAAQSRLDEIQGTGGIWYAGAWIRYGFHEDGILSGVRVAEALGAVLPWGDELDEARVRVRGDAG